MCDSLKGVIDGRGSQVILFSVDVTRGGAELGHLTMGSMLHNHGSRGAGDKTCAFSAVFAAPGRVRKWRNTAVHVMEIISYRGFVDKT